MSEDCIGILPGPGGVGKSRLGAGFFAVVIMDMNQKQDPDAQEATLFYPVPHSHWFPRSLAFKSYRPSRRRPELGPGQRGARKPHSQISRPLSVKLTKEIVNTYRVCNPRFQFSESHNPKRFLTIPSAGVSNNGSDNENHDLILYFGRVLVNEDRTHRYVVKDIVGCGTFGQVAKCLVPETNEYVAVKIIKNQSAYSAQAKVEIGILHRLNNIRDWRNENHVVRSFDHFSYEGHLCIVFELLGVNLFELLKTNKFKGISLQLVRIFTGQLLDALSLLHDARVIHCDLKPENILLSSLRAAELKLIDFGSACMEEHTVYSYIQSRFYRSPEVVLGHPYTTAIDMWSLGCVAAELFLGLPLFPGQCPYDLLLFIIEKLGKQPSDHILQNAKNTSKYFKVISAAPQPENGHISGHKSVYQFLTPEENEAREKKKPVIGRRYMSGSLEDMIMTYPMKSSGREELEKERFSRKVFIDFLRGLIEVDPHKRWTPHEASQHPFLTQEPFTGSFRPRTERISHAPSGLGLMIEHPSLFGQGLSPHVGIMSSTAQLIGGQQLQPVSLPVPGSPASSGDNGTLGSSLGSIGEGTGSSMSMPPRLNGHTSFGPWSPDTRRHHMQRMQNAGHTQLGTSPSASGVCSFSLGASPSHQFHVSGPQFMVSPASQQISSPGSQYMGSSGILYQGFPGSTFQSSPGSSVPYDNVLLARLQQHNAAGNTDVSSSNFGHVEGSLQLKTLRVCGNTGMVVQHQLNNTCPPGALGPQFFPSETTTEAGDEECAGFGDFDGDYR